jgi:hypothetical protein
MQTCIEKRYLREAQRMPRKAENPRGINFVFA